jgi:hypothetical protein
MRSADEGEASGEITMYPGRKTEIGKLRQFEQELSAQYGESVLRKHWDEAKDLFEHRRKVRRAILQHEEWNVDGLTVEDGKIIELPVAAMREEAIAEDLARVA